MQKLTPTGDHIYTFAYTEDEKALCQLEMRSFFGKDTEAKMLQSPARVNPSRSPFIKERIEVLFQSVDLEEMLRQMEHVKMGTETFKVIFVKINDLPEAEKVEFQEKRNIERQLGQIIEGEADVHHPDKTFGLVAFEGQWYFGHYRQSEAVWFRHQKKPRAYSTALSTRVARAVANIAVPELDGKRVIDPCCGIGTVLVEGLSMGMNIVGRDINPLVVDGSRENIAHFGLTGTVELGPIEDIVGDYDVAIIDMPYNLYTSATPEDQTSILAHAGNITEKLVVVTLDSVDHMVEQAGFRITDRCIAKKAGFEREILVCEK